MLILGIESTCDETAAAVVEDGILIHSNVVSSQMDLHRPFGGVVPEIAARRHLELIEPVVDAALQGRSVDAVAVAQGPGLLGALLVGLNFAKGLALGWKKPLIGINHVEAHLYAAIMTHPEEVRYPALGVVVSGGHTALVKINAVGTYQLIGATVDDAAGEAFDKVAALLGLPYPGGPEVEKLAKQGDPNRISLKAGQVKGRPFDFSFSGIKTNVLYAAKGQSASRNDPLLLNAQARADLAAAFQEAALGDIFRKAQLAAKEFECHSILLGGGVTQNQRLRELFQGASVPVLWPSRDLLLDNAAMIAGLAYPYSQKGPLPDGLALLPQPRMPLRFK
ncbi:MAG: tRNA (adenosine(37)-N6)-threonylcarbamoyltransferase complex transferase subunit TsaD [Verrucomicrobia bacterium]|nr:tRNA (adenosine(37)-N6)-threonylcarbamoyltransferase complex transferase subunit TsaD [Verrucomicrobiota bacterium]